MKSGFLTRLRMEALLGPDGLPLYSRDERRLFELTDRLVYWSELLQQLIVADPGYVTDFGSVPRIPLVYYTLGDIAHEPYVIHDLMYSKHTHTRKQADDVLLEGLECVGIPPLKRRAIWLGVRIGGYGPYHRE